MKAPRLFLAGLLAWACCSPAMALEMQDPGTDFAFLELEPYPAFQGDAPAAGSQNRFWRLAGQLSFPAGKFGNKQFFGSFKSTLIDRDIVYDDTLKLNDGMLKRFWQSGGMIWPNGNGQSNCLLVGLGVNSDFADLSLVDFNTEWIYSHTWQPRPVFSWGLGISVQQKLNKAVPYPLFFVDWKAGEKTRFKWDADYLEMRRFLSPWLCFTAGVRFNLEFFALADEAEYEYNSMGLETGFQYAVGGNMYVRLKYKELVWGSETLALPDGSSHTQDIGPGAGRSLRLNLAYGL